MKKVKEFILILQIPEKGYHNRDLNRSLNLDLLQKTEGKDSECFVIGGGQIYKLFIDIADRLYITHVNQSFPNADTFFPDIDTTKWEKTSGEKYPRDEKNNYDLEFAIYNKK